MNRSVEAFAQMQRLIAALLIGSLLGGGGSASVVAQSQVPEPTTTPGAVVFGGRIEISSAGFALTVPGDWYAFDLSDPDLIAKMEVFDATTPMAAPMTPMASPIVQHLVTANLEPNVADTLLLALGPTNWESCVVVVGTTDAESLDLVMAMAGLEPGFVDLPAGRTGTREYTIPRPDGDDVEATNFVWLRDGVVHALTCADVVRHSDVWLSIAESFEFLPAGE